MDMNLLLDHLHIVTIPTQSLLVERAAVRAVSSAYGFRGLGRGRVAINPTPGSKKPGMPALDVFQ
jgi:hypothetical protein